MLKNRLANGYRPITKGGGAWLKLLLKSIRLLIPLLLADRYQLTSITTLPQFFTFFRKIQSTNVIDKGKFIHTPLKRGSFLLMMLKWCFHKKILRNISQNLLQEFSCTLHKTTANTGFFFTLFSRIHGVLIQWIRENYSKNIQKLYSIVFCPNTGKCGAKKPAFTVVLCSGSLSPFYLWHNKETIILYLHFICKFIEPFLSKPFFCCEIACSTHYFLNFYMIPCSWKPFRNQEVSITIF